MGKKIKKYKNGLWHFLQWEGGQRFFNFAYSIGAAIVIWGALFKILHLPGGNTLLSIGMGTEVLMFILTAFDRPPKEYNWEEVFPVLDSKNPEDRPNFEGGSGIIVGGSGGTVTVAGGVSGAQAKAAAGIPAGVALTPEDTKSLSDSIAKMAAASEQLSRMAELTSATQQYLDQMGAIAQEMSHLRETTESLNRVSEVLLESYSAITQNSESITASSNGYVDQMKDLNRNIGGLNTIYEIQLKSVSSQLDSIDRVNRGIKDIRDMYEKSSAQAVRYCEETERMARYMQQLNSVYEKMLTAMTINMYRPMMGADAQAPAQQAPTENV
ncbi:MAG: gliding motility protein GldL [Muribaculaceae bacterium]|nr:gliding motility protein GldL [Muribaculaceae bacterium]